MFNMLVVPGLAVPTGSNIYSIFTDNLTKPQDLLSNFYQLESADFLVILILQQTMFSVLNSVNRLADILFFYGSPSIFLLFKRLSPKEQQFQKDEADTFDYGYINALNLTIFSIVVIYW